MDVASRHKHRVLLLGTQCAQRALVRTCGRNVYRYLPSRICKYAKVQSLLFEKCSASISRWCYHKKHYFAYIKNTTLRKVLAVCNRKDATYEKTRGLVIVSFNTWQYNCDYRNTYIIRHAR